MKRSIFIALFLALPIEIMSDRFCVPPLDVGLPPDAPWYVQAMAWEWVILHLPGSLLLRLNMVSSTLWVPILYAAGYLTTAVLLFLLIWLVRAVLRLVRRGSQHAADSNVGGPTPVP